MREIAVRHAACPPETLRKLAADPDPTVRFGVAGNPSTPTDVIETLARDEDPDVRFGAADNESSPHLVLLTLADDEVSWVADQARFILQLLAERRG